MASRHGDDTRKYPVVEAARAAGWRLLEMDEGLVDDAWLRKKPKWQTYQGLPISFAMVWRKDP